MHGSGIQGVIEIILAVSVIMVCSNFSDTEAPIIPTYFKAPDIPAVFLANFSMTLHGVKLGHYATELHTLSVTHILCNSALTNTMDNLSEICPLNLRDF